MGMLKLLTVVVQIIDIDYVGAVKTENDPPIRANCHGPKTLHLAFERMQSETRNIHIRDGLRGVEPRKDIAQLNNMFGDDAARVVIFMKTFQSLVAYRPYRSKP